MFEMPAPSKGTSRLLSLESTPTISRAQGSLQTHNPLLLQRAPRGSAIPDTIHYGEELVPEPTDFQWLVERRSQIQRTLLNLHECPPSKLLSPDGDGPILGWAWGFLVGAAFSLWRAVFLAETAITDEDSWPKIHAHARTFLKDLIETNTIVFSKDQSTRVWSCRYYLHNAYCKILAAVERLRPAAFAERALATLEVVAVLQQLETGFSNTSRRDLWDKAFGALVVLVALLTDKTSD